MKARTKSTRWLLLTLLVGLMAAAGLALTWHHATPALAKANPLAPPAHTAVKPPQAALVASTGTPHGATPRFHGVATSSYSSSELPDPIKSRSDSHSDASTGNSGGGWGNHAAEQTDDSTGAPQPQIHPATADTRPVPLAGSGDYAYQGYAPLGCEVPAGCGAVGDTGYVTRQTSGTSGGLGLPTVHNSQGPSSGDDDSTPPPNNSGPQNNDSGQNPPGTGTPGQKSDPPAVSAPELDAGTLGGAVTLLLGALAITRGRRPARVTR
jgi:nicotinate-nucleotide--dimethylbenzimidazole phosphoribosyltransferase